jgi:hypothetical protein
MIAPTLDSPRRWARVCGALYLYIIVAGSFAEIFVRSRLVVTADAAATARNILGNELLFRVGFSGELLHLACDVAVAVLLYALLVPVDRYVALLAALMRVACDVVLAVASLSHFAALRLLAAAGPAERFPPDQREALALLAMRLHGDAYAISLVFFGLACLALGYLLFRSGFLPRPLGVLLVIAGACYLASSFGHFLVPGRAATIFPALFVPVFVAELSLTLWLIAKGVDAARWHERSRASPGGRA